MCFEEGSSWSSVFGLTFHPSHMGSPGPVLSGRHGCDIVFWIGMHGLSHEGAIHVDGVITANKIPCCNDNILSCMYIYCIHLNRTGLQLRVMYALHIIWVDKVRVPKYLLMEEF